MNESKQLTVVNPGEMFKVATDVASVCKEIVTRTAVNIQGNKYVKCEGWNAIAAAHGCAAGITNVEQTETGFRAVAELKRLSDGMVIATAEGFVGLDEEKWAEGKEYAMRAMAQTRAISRVCRSAFAHVVVLIDEGLQTTPAEEIPEGGFTKASAFQQARNEMMKQETGPNRPAPRTYSHDWRDCIVHFTKNAGKQLGELNDKQISWYYKEWMPNKKAEVNPKYPISQKDQNLFDALEQWHAEKHKEETDLPLEPEPVPAPATEEADEIPF